MHKYLLCLSLALLAPTLASAANATSNTGGNSVGSGGTIRTGSEFSSVQVTNVGGNGQSSIYIKTDAGGNVHEETVVGQGSVDVSIKADPQETQVEIKKSNEPVVKKIIPAQTSAAVQVSAQVESSTTPGTTTVPVESQGIVERIFSWLGGLFSFWR